MRFVKGKVKAGKIVVAGEKLVDGEEVGVVLREDEDDFELTPEHVAFLDRSIADIEAGRFTDGPALLRKLARRNAQLRRHRLR